MLTNVEQRASNAERRIDAAVRLKRLISASGGDGAARLLAIGQQWPGGNCPRSMLDTGCGLFDVRRWLFGHRCASAPSAAAVLLLGLLFLVPASAFAAETEQAAPPATATNAAVISTNAFVGPTNTAVVSTDATVSSTNTLISTTNTPAASTNVLSFSADVPPTPPSTNNSLDISTNAFGGMDKLDDEHRLSVGDKLSLRIIEDEEPPQPLIVTDVGAVDIPYIGRIAAAGKTCKNLAREIKVELEKEYYYQATVILAIDALRSKGKVYLVGKVRAPGPQELPMDEPLTLSKAIMRAGGFAEFADEAHVKLTRRATYEGTEKIQFEVNVRDIQKKGQVDKDMVLLPEDLIYIPSRLMSF